MTAVNCQSVPLALVSPFLLHAFQPWLAGHSASAATFEGSGPDMAE